MKDLRDQKDFADTPSWKAIHFQSADIPCRNSNLNLPAEKLLELQAWFGPTLGVGGIVLSEAGIGPPRDSKARLGIVPSSWCRVSDHFRQISQISGFKKEKWVSLMLLQGPRAPDKHSPLSSVFGT